MGGVIGWGRGIQTGIKKSHLIGFSKKKRHHTIDRKKLWKNGRGRERWEHAKGVRGRIDKPRVARKQSKVLEKNTRRKEMGIKAGAKFQKQDITLKRGYN